MKKMILLLMVLILPTSLAASYYDVYLNYDAGKITLDQISVEPLLQQVIYSSVGDHSAEIVDSSGKKLYQINFYLTAIRGRDINNWSHTYIDSNFTWQLSLPYYKLGKTLNLYDEEGTKMLAVDLSDYVQAEEKEVVKLGIIQDLSEEVVVDSKLGELVFKDYNGGY